MKLFRRVLPLVASLLVPGAIAAQYTGTFTVPNQAGGITTLVLRQSSAGDLTGSFSGNGIRYTLEGRIEDGVAVGSMSGTQGLLYFEAERWENELWLMVYGSDADGQPDYDDFTEIDLVEAGAAADGQRPRPPAPRVPATGPLGPTPGANPLAPGGGQDPYVGTFSDGNVTLTLTGGAGQYAGQVSVGGASYPVRAQGGAQGIQGLIEAPDGQYALAAQPQGQSLIVVSGGMQYALVRVSGGAVGGRAGGQGLAGQVRSPRPGSATGRTRSGRQLAPGFTEDHPQVAEWNALLAGKKLTTMESYSSGSAGGYSARTDIFLCSDRSFAMRDESSVSVDVGGAFGNSGGVGGGQGEWYVITNGQVVGLVLEFASGEAREFRMDYDVQSQATYANGVRVYVTPAGVCM